MPQVRRRYWVSFPQIRLAFWPTAVESAGDGQRVVKVWTPLHAASGRVVGATEVTLDDAAVTQIVADARTTVWYAVGLVFGALWLVLALLVRGASTRMHTQHADLETR